MNKRTALVFGASGLVGGELLRLLLANENYNSILSCGRKKLNLKHPKLAQLVIDFNHLESYKEHFAANDVYCCLGTTIKKAKSKEGWVFTLDFPSYFPFMTYAKSRDLRKEMSIAAGSKTAKGDELDNQKNVLKKQEYLKKVKSKF